MSSPAARAVALLQNNSLSPSSIIAEIDSLDSVQTSIDVFFILASGYLVFFMQAGFAMLTAGSVRTKNTKNVLLKNVLDAAVGSIAYFLFGWALANGPREDKFIGWGHFALSNYDGLAFNDYHSFFFAWSFAATAATIVSGAMAERTSLYGYLGYAFVLTAFVYPVVSHWVWSGNGWASNFFGASMIDFAGCSVVHMTGGFAGLIGAIIVGPRLGRFDSDGKVVPIPGHSATLCTLGTFILWFGWYGFNPGSALGIGGTLRETAARCAVTTTLAAASAGCTTLAIVKARDGIFDLLASLNGILAGLVSITASCAFVDGWAAIVIGFIGSIVYLSAASLLLLCRVDDPLEEFPIHGACGFWGVIAGGLFNRGVYQVTAGCDGENFGLLYGGGWRLLACNVVGALAIAGWTTSLLGLVFAYMRLGGVLRISAAEEVLGNDLSKHGGVAYPLDEAGCVEYSATHSNTRV